MARDVDPYWRIFASEAPSDLGIQMTDQQVEDLAYAMEGAHENYGLGSGRDIADANLRANHDREVEKRGMEKVLRFIDERIARLDSGSSRMFDFMSHNQKMAMAEIFQARRLVGGSR